MIVPIALAGIMALVGWKLASGKLKPISTRDTRVGADAGFVWNPYTNAWERPQARPQLPPGSSMGAMPTQSQVGQYLMVYFQYITSGQMPPLPVLQQAHREAQVMGDWQTVQQIEQIYQMLQQPAVSGQAEEVVTGADLGGAESQFDGMEMVQATVSTQAVPTPAGARKSAPAPKEQPVATIPDGCPIDGVPLDEWAAFVNLMRTRTPDFSDENYLGSFEHNRRRLRQLAIPESEVANANGQYQAFCRDMGDYYEKCKKLIDDYVGDAVEIDGNQVPITLSGVMGVLKAAGPQGAKSWFANSEDRKSFPNTTAVFLRCNNCF